MANPGFRGIGAGGKTSGKTNEMDLHWERERDGSIRRSMAVRFYYHKILRERKTVDQARRAVLAFLTILIKKKCLADWLINQPILLNQNKWL